MGVLIDAVDPAVHGGSAPGVDHGTAALLAHLGLAVARVISADGDSFTTLECTNQEGRRCVLKFVSSGSADAYRRLRNEALLLTYLRTRPPLKLLPPLEAGRGYLLTGFDAGVLLRPELLGADDMIAAIASALAQFQSLRPDASRIGLTDRERLTTYYYKVLAKHVLHLWPILTSVADAARCAAILTASLPAILRRQVICHGDFLPTNLLYDAAAGTVTFTDLEGFMTRNHPLFDVVALFTMNDRDLDEWEWQPRFLRHYLRAAGPQLGLDPMSADFAAAYRGILVFFLVYRLNEARVHRGNGLYFDGIGKARYVRRKMAALATPTAWRDDETVAALRVRTRNLRKVLSRSGFRAHLAALTRELPCTRVVSAAAR